MGEVSTPDNKVDASFERSSLLMNYDVVRVQVSLAVTSDAPGKTGRHLMVAWNDAESRLHFGAITRLIDFAQVSILYGQSFSRMMCLA